MKEVIDSALKAYHQEKLAIFRKENKNSQEGGIVFVGDSLIDFFPLKKLLGRDLPLINRGIAGIDTDFLLEHLDVQVLDLNPKQVFILIGTNDIGMGKDLATIYEHILSILSDIKSQLLSCHIHVLSLLPVNQSKEFQAKVKIRNNALIKQLNADLSVIPAIDFIDVHKALSDKEGNLRLEYTSDGLHLTAKGYEELAQLLKIYL